MERGKEKCNRLLLIIFLAVLLLHAACGIKGPPKVPRALVPPPVTDLEAAAVGHEIRLTWSVPERDDTAYEGIAGFKVYGSDALDVETPCPECPISFSERLDVRLKGKKPAEVDEGRVVCHVNVVPGRRYAFKVVAYHKGGGVSKDSNIVQVTAE